jgi:hypothetical protein
MILFRPVGLVELRLVAASGWRAWPPRLAQQPIFYPVLTAEYARKIARDWNTVDEASGFAGFVTEFAVEDSFMRRYEPRAVGGRSHEELWVPAEDLDELNRHLLGRIRVIEAYAGPRFAGTIDPVTKLPDELASTTLG